MARGADYNGDLSRVYREGRALSEATLSMWTEGEGSKVFVRTTVRQGGPELILGQRGGHCSWRFSHERSPTGQRNSVPGTSS
jgi:hypothetical protein